MSNSKSFQISRILLSILTDHYGLDSSSDFLFLQSFYKLLGTIPSAPISTSITIILKSQSFLILWQDSSIFLYHYFYSLRVFHMSVSWWSFTAVWMTASHLTSPWLFSIFWPILTMLVWAWFVSRFSTFSATFSSLWGSFPVL